MPALFSTEIKVIDDEVEGVSFQCSDKYAGKIATYLAAQGIQCGTSEVEVQGTRNIHSFVRVPVTGSNFTNLIGALKGMLNQQGVRFQEERYSLPGEVTVTLHLPDVSVFDKP